MIKNKRNSLVILATLSGVCGISYELLYSRMLSSYFGDMYYITAAILMGFLVSLGVGALVAHRFVRYLPHIEIGIGLYAFLAAFVFNTHIESLVETAVSVGDIHAPFVLTLVVVLLLVVPAFLIGFSVPIFALYLEDEPRSYTGFKRAYLVYNMGAAFAILLIEFFLVQQFGITAAAVAIGSLNILVGLVLFRLVSPEVQAVKKVEQAHVAGMNNATALFLVSIASGIFQLFCLELTYRIFGPFNENLAIVLATVFFGLTLGTYLVSRLKISFSNTLVLIGVALSLTAIVITPLIYLNAYAISMLGATYGMAALIKVGLIVLFGMTAFVSFGMTVPAHLRGLSENGGVEREQSGRALAISAFGNALGFFLTTFVLHYYFDTPHIILAAFLTAVLAYLLAEKKDNRRVVRITKSAMAAASVIFIAALSVWPHLFLRVGYDRLSSIEGLRAVTYEVVGSTDFRHFGDYVSVLDVRDGRRLLVYNGYFSLDLAASSSSVAFREALVGIVGSHYSENSERALVLGLGTGITAGASAEVYETVDVVDINPAMLDVADEFRLYNFDLPNKENVNIHIEDGIVELIRTEKTYDTIINTVASPAYFSASKLWTVEALELVKARLRPGGVYVSWLDSRAGIHGIRTQLQTLMHVFPSCRYIFLNTQYYAMVCSEQSLAMAKERGQLSGSLLRLLEQHGITGNPEVFQSDLDITPEEEVLQTLVMGSAAPALNTMDMPVLEFLGSAHMYIEDEETLAFFKAFATLPKDIDDETLARRCEHLDLVVANRSRFLEQLPECAAILQGR